MFTLFFLAAMTQDWIQFPSGGGILGFIILCVCFCWDCMIISSFCKRIGGDKE